MAALPVIEEGLNCLIVAPTGSGKTEAAALPVLKALEGREGQRGIAALYITPLRALNRDMIKRLEWLAKEAGVSIGVRHGDTLAKERQQQALNPPLFLITTPETLQNLFLSPRLRESLRNVRFVVVDEVHELYHNKRGAQLALALERLVELSPDFVRIGLSATIGNVDDACAFLFSGRKHRVVLSPQTKRLEVRIEMPLKAEKYLPQFAESFGLDREAFARISRVAELIRGSQATLVFANTRQVVESLGNKLLAFERIESFGSIGIHHSSIDKNERIATEDSFKEGRIRSIIATSSLELGIDIGKVDLVIQYGSPRQVVRLFQRVGRAGHREHAVSRGVVMVSDFLEGVESIAVAEAAEKQDLERPSIEYNALDVLANQICSIVLEYRKIEISRLESIVRRAAPYRELSKKSFDSVLDLVSDLRMIKHDGKFASLGARSRTYFINNISVIPDTNRIFVRTVVGNRLLASLDETFVSAYLDVGTTFITKGLPWKVVSVEEDRVYVEPADDNEAAVPDWEGEDIPVSYNVSKRVFGIIGNVGLGKAYADSETISQLQSFADKQRAFFVPSNDTVYIEELENYTLIYLALGRSANEYLARIMNAIIIPMVGKVVRVRASPYAIIIDYSGAPRRADMSRVFALLMRFDPSSVPGIMAASDLYRRKFVQVAKVFGIIDKSATTTRSMVSRLVSFYENSVVGEETMRDMNKNYFDAKTVNRFIEDIAGKKLRIEIVRKSGSPLSTEILLAAYHHSELLSQVESEKEIEHMIKKFEGRSVKLMCAFCGQVFTVKVDIDREGVRKCPVCGSSMLAMHQEKYEPVIAKRKSGRALNSAEHKLYADINRESSLLQSYGDKAIIALETYGVGLETAARLLRFMRKDKKTFFLDVIKAQKEFIKNRKFWKVS